MLHSPLSTKCSGYRSFTLIELLVVIAIISIIAAILFPVFARARENARRTSCLSNMKQIGLGVLQYTQDYDERYPVAWHGLGAVDTDTSKPSGYFNLYGGHVRTWMDIIYPYTKSLQIYVCPSTRSARSPNYSYSVAFSGAGGAYVTAFGKTMPADTPIGLADVVRPAEVLGIMEYTSAYAYLIGPSDFINYINSPTYPTILTPHLEGGNAVYADGHAKWRSKGRMLADLPPNSHANNNCNIASPDYTNRYCSRAWNPFLN